MVVGIGLELNDGQNIIILKITFDDLNYSHHDLIGTKLRTRRALSSSLLEADSLGPVPIGPYLKTCLIILSNQNAP
ncbi:hypothetical protein TNCV_4224501 [Trichonephila clavipes]|nr:hypothetical protein TNCV_4224501 [Trichonephila clavipes]